MWNLESYRRDGPQEESDRLWSTGFVKSIFEESSDVDFDLHPIEIPEESTDDELDFGFIDIENYCS